MAKCKNCKHLLRTINKSFVHNGIWCPEIIDSPHEDIERDCKYYEPMTNADRIRSMTDEELALVLKRAFNCGGLIAMNQSSAECRDCKDGYCCNIDDWLKARNKDEDSKN